MNEYIKQTIENESNSICLTCIHRLVCKAIDNQPCTECNQYQNADDVAEVRHGRWVPKDNESVSKRNRLIKYEVYSCSICGRSNGRIRKKYCPNCGARMDKEDKHGS